MTTESQVNRLGMNRTGLQMSPQDSQRLLELSTHKEVDISALAVTRGLYIADADPLGSVPIPLSLKGMAKSGTKMLTGKHPEVFMDKLAERLAFERGGTRLYDALIAKFNASPVPINGVAAHELRQIRNEELQHFQLLTEAIRRMGGDPTAQTPSADLVGVESSGLIQVVSDPRTSFADSLHAVIVAELADVNSWELLVSLAQTMGEDQLAESFRVALDEEVEHLDNVSMWYEQLITSAE